MVQGHVFDTLLTPAARAEPCTSTRRIFHGSTAPGFLFASGFVAGLPRAPLSLARPPGAARGGCSSCSASATRCTCPTSRSGRRCAGDRRGEGGALRLRRAPGHRGHPAPGARASSGRRAGAGRGVAAVLGLVVLAAGPFVWASGLSARLPALPRRLPRPARRGSHVPRLPLRRVRARGHGGGRGARPAGARASRRRRAVAVRARLLLGRASSSRSRSQGAVDFWGVSPAYVLLRLGGLLLLLRLVEAARGAGVAGHPRPGPPRPRDAARLRAPPLPAVRRGPRPRAARGLARTPRLRGRLRRRARPHGPVLLAAAGTWHRVKTAAPQEATLALAFLAIGSSTSSSTRPW